MAQLVRPRIYGRCWERVIENVPQLGGQILVLRDDPASTAGQKTIPFSPVAAEDHQPAASGTKPVERRAPGRHWLGITKLRRDRAQPAGRVGAQCPALGRAK